MTRCVALLRGVNVGGVTIKMAELAELLRGLGYADVKTVLASGNAVFATELDAAEAATRIEGALAARFGRSTRVHVLDTERLRRIVAACPFPAREGWHRYVVFLLDPELDPAGVAAIAAAVADRQADGGADGGADGVAGQVADGADESIAESERIVRGDGVLYWTVERGRTLDSPFGKSLGTAALRGSTTNRNLNTLEKLLR